MPSHLPSSFASAAAGQNANRDGKVKPDGRGEWPRRESRPTNGTMTFRRPPSNSLGQPTQNAGVSGDSAALASMAAESRFLIGRQSQITASAYTAPSSASTLIHTPGPQETGRYSKDDLLDLFQAQMRTSHPSDVSRLFMPYWNPAIINGGPSRDLGRLGDGNGLQDPTLCWDAGGDNLPMGLRELSPEEREAFSADINSTLKPHSTKDNTSLVAGINGRKLSLGNGGNGIGVTSPPSTARPSARRRESAEPGTFGALGLVSPTLVNRPLRDEPTPWFSRRNAESKDSENEEREDDIAAPTPNPLLGRPSALGQIMRNNTTGSTSNGGNNPWASTSPSVSSIGAFGNFALPSAALDKRFGSQKGESRLAHLIPKDIPKDTDSLVNSRTDNPPTSATLGNSSGGDLGRPWGVSQSDVATVDTGRAWRPRPRTDTDPFGHDSLTTGAILTASQDRGPSPQAKYASNSVQNPSHRSSSGDLSLSALIIDSSHIPRESTAPPSPSATNPYGSPLAEMRDLDGDESGLDREITTTSAFNPLVRAYAATNSFEGSDRSQTSSAGARNYPTLSNLAGWPSTSGPVSATPDREHRSAYSGAFGSSVFNPIATDLNSPGLSSIGGFFNPPVAPVDVSTVGPLGRSGKLNGLFLPPLQSHLSSQDHDSLADSLPDLRQANPLGAIGRNMFGAATREADSPLRSARGMGSFDDFFPPTEATRPNPIYSGGDGGTAAVMTPQQQSLFAGMGGGALGGTSTADNSPPASQQVRQMVMPDRMRWVYLDPQGHVQGPFTGLEMHDWYKGSFFTPDLRVKKVEDADFEPLGHLIRRIGNSREPFLVPQVGIAHGPAPNVGPFSPSSSGGVVPPLSGVFPSFGRTLTAEEQNNLERRKQEEQFMMAQQREFVMRQQALAKFHIQTTTPVLQHQSSAHSLQSQHSYGSLTSPIGLTPQPPIAPMFPTTTTPSLYDATGLGHRGSISGTVVTAAAASVAAAAAATSGSTNGMMHLMEPEDGDQEAHGWPHVAVASQVHGGQSFNDRPFDATSMPAAQAGPLSHLQGYAALRGQLPRTEALTDDDEGFKKRLYEFEELRAELDAETDNEERSVANTAALYSSTNPNKSLVSNVTQGSRQPLREQTKHDRQRNKKEDVDRGHKAVSLATALGSGENDGPLPFPPASPGPTLQRKWSSVTDPYGRLQSEASDNGMAAAAAAAAVPPLAPWAKELGSESSKGPSLKEIQEAEARKAAKAMKAEELAASIRRRQAFELEIALKEREKASGSSVLPMTSTWGSGSGSGSSSTGAPPTTGPWAKSAAFLRGPPPPPIGSGAGAGPALSERKRTLAEIQLEEEARKQRANRLVSQSMTAGTGSKSYAILAGKAGAGVGAQQAGSIASPASVPTTGAGWATVGADGKVKAPTVPATQTQSQTQPHPARTANVSVKISGSGTGRQTAANRGRIDLRSQAINNDEAMEEFRKWVRSQLARGITGGIDIDSLAADLEKLPLDNNIIADAVYLNSNIMNGRDFADEYIRRKKLADCGIVERQPTALITGVRSGSGGAGGAGGVSSESKDGEDGSGSGWNEVVKRGGGGPAAGNAAAGSGDNVQGAGFKVVPGRKKGKK